MRLCHLLSCRRGWPESANTWEPYENLASVPDVVDAFEQRFLSSFVLCICVFVIFLVILSLYNLILLKNGIQQR